MHTKLSYWMTPNHVTPQGLSVSMNGDRVEFGFFDEGDMVPTLTFSCTPEELKKIANALNKKPAVEKPK